MPKENTKEVLDFYATQQGWNRESQMLLVMQYLEQYPKVATLKEFLHGVAEMENDTPSARDVLEKYTQHLSDSDRVNLLLRFCAEEESLDRLEDFLRKEAEEPHG